jgi:nitric oxide synthase-interacting protein
MKGLLPVIFTYPGGKSSPDTNPICPSCSREMTNATRSVLLTSKAPADAEPPSKKKKDGKEKNKEVSVCGHVVCGTCADTVVKPGKQCLVCEATVRPDKDMIDLGKEGLSICQGLSA